MWRDQQNESEVGNDIILFFDILFDFKPMFKQRTCRKYDWSYILHGFTNVWFQILFHICDLLWRNREQVGATSVSVILESIYTQSIQPCNQPSMEGNFWLTYYMYILQ